MTAMTRTRATPLSAIRLTGRRALLNRSLQTAAGLFTLVALATYFVPWHEVRNTGFGDGLACAFMPDCHMTPSVTTEAELLARAPDAVHSGLDDSGWIPIAILLVLAAMRAVSLLRPRFWLELTGAVLGLAGLGLALVAMFDLAHLFDHTVSLTGERIFAAAAVGLGLAALIDLPLQPILYTGQRRAEALAAASPRELPRASLRRPDARARRARRPSGCAGAVRAGTTSGAAGGTTRRR
jgi:hypothetical protein